MGGTFTCSLPSSFIVLNVDVHVIALCQREDWSMALGCSGHGPYSLPSVVFALDLLWDAFPLTDQNPQFFNIFLTVEGFAFLSPLLSFCRCTKIMTFIVTFSLLFGFLGWSPSSSLI